jgi:uncharacterized protein (TIGR03067 family)
VLARAIVLFACLTAPLPTDARPDQSSAGTIGQAATAAPCSAQPLAGTWKVQSMTMDGRPSGDPEMSGATITFTASRLTIETRQQVSSPFTFEVDAAGSPCALHVTPLGKSTEPAGWMLFAIEGGNLRLGFHDNLSRRAASFEARPNMVVLQLSRVPGAQ